MGAMTMPPMAPSAALRAKLTADIACASMPTSAAARRLKRAGPQALPSRCA